MANYKDNLLISPRYKGERFKGAAMPLSLLAELSAFENAIREMVRVLYLQKNPDSKRLPKGIWEGISFHTNHIKDGSAQPDINVRINEDDTLFPSNEKITLIKDALTQVIEMIHEAATNPKAVPHENYKSVAKTFRNYGKGLQDEESIFFGSHEGDSFEYTKATRAKIIQMYEVENYEEDVAFRGCINGVQADKAEANLLCPDGTSLSFKIPTEELALFTECLTSYVSSNKDYSAADKILIQGTALYTKGRFNKFVSDMEVEQLHRRDFLTRVLFLVEATKKEGASEWPALSEHKAKRFAALFEKFFDIEQLPRPYTYPLQDEEGLCLEWRGFPDWNIELEVQFNEHFEAMLYLLHKGEEDRDVELELVLASPMGWSELTKTFTKHHIINNHE